MLGLHLSKTIPSTSSVSSMVPPNFLTILMSFKSTFVAVRGSIILSTASTAIGESSSVLVDTTFELREVFTHSIKVSLFEISTGIERDLITSRDLSRALWKPK